VCRIQHIENPIRDKSKEFALHKLTLADSEEYGNIKNTTSLHFIFLVLFESSKLSLSHSFFIVSSTRQGRAASGGVFRPEAAAHPLSLPEYGRILGKMLIFV